MIVTVTERERYRSVSNPLWRMAVGILKSSGTQAHNIIVRRSSTAFSIFCFFYLCGHGFILQQHNELKPQSFDFLKTKYSRLSQCVFLPPDLNPVRHLQGTLRLGRLNLPDDVTRSSLEHCLWGYHSNRRKMLHKNTSIRINQKNKTSEHLKCKSISDEWK